MRLRGESFRPDAFPKAAQKALKVDAKATDLKEAKIFSSPLTRAVQTALVAFEPRLLAPIASHSGVSVIALQP